jgi:hypothetical protein
MTILNSLELPHAQPLSARVVMCYIDTHCPRYDTTVSALFTWQGNDVSCRKQHFSGARRKYFLSQLSTPYLKNAILCLSEYFILSRADKFRKRKSPRASRVLLLLLHFSCAQSINFECPFSRAFFSGPLK